MGSIEKFHLASNFIPGYSARMDSLQEWFQAERGRRIFLARQLGISPSAVTMWKNVPAERVLEIERITGISRHDLRPDLYPREAA